MITVVTSCLFQSRESIKFADSIIVQGYNIYIPFLKQTVYVLTTHGRFDNIQVCVFTRITRNNSWRPDIYRIIDCLTYNVMYCKTSVMKCQSILT